MLPCTSYECPLSAGLSFHGDSPGPHGAHTKVRRQMIKKTDMYIGSILDGVES